MSRLTPENGGRKIAVISELINLEDNPDAPIDLEKMRHLFERAGVNMLFSIHHFQDSRQFSRDVCVQIR